MPLKIVINGREYNGVDQMPPDVRQQYLQLVGTLGDADGCRKARDEYLKRQPPGLHAKTVAGRCGGN